MYKVATTIYDVAEHIRTHEERIAYLHACIEEADGNHVFIAKAFNDIVRSLRPNLSSEFRPY